MRRKPKARVYTTSELARSLAVPREHLLSLCESGLIEARPNGRGDYIVEGREKERVVREGLPELPESTDRQAELIAARLPIPVSSVLHNRLESLKSKQLELTEVRTDRELRRIREDDAALERQRIESRRTETVANKRVLAEIRLQRERDAERHEREQREAEAERRQAEFERRWTQWAADRLFAWLTFEQRQALLRMVEEAVNAHGPEDEATMQRLLADAIARMCAPFAAEREARAKREKLIEEILWRPPYGGTDLDTARAAADARAVLLQIPLGAGDLEIRAALSAAVEPITKPSRSGTRPRRPNLERPVSLWPVCGRSPAISANFTARARSRSLLTVTLAGSGIWRKKPRRL